MPSPTQPDPWRLAGTLAWASPAIAIVSGAALFASFFAFQGQRVPIRYVAIATAVLCLAGVAAGIIGARGSWQMRRWGAFTGAIAGIAMGGFVAYTAVIAVMMSFARF